MYLHSGGKEAESTKRVRLIASDPPSPPSLMLTNRAKYIEGLENRLGRMESLLRLSGLLTEADAGKTDLSVLERRLADKSSQSSGLSSKPSTASSGFNQTNQPSPSTSTPHADSHTSPRTPATSPDSQKETEAELDTLSDMMCSLVTNNCGETRYIGKAFQTPSDSNVIRSRVNRLQDRRLAFRYSHRKASNGSTRKREILRFKT